MRKKCLIKLKLRILNKKEKTMKKAEFASLLAEKCNLQKKQAIEIMDAFWELTLDAMKKGDEVVFEYGKFVLKKKAARQGINPKTKEPVQIPAKIVPQFKPNKKFKDAASA